MRGYKKKVCFALSYFLKNSREQTRGLEPPVLKGFFWWLCVIHGTRGGTWCPARGGTLQFVTVRGSTWQSIVSWLLRRYVAFTRRYVDITCHYVVLRGYYVADTIKFYEGLTQRLRGLPVALRMLWGSSRGPRFTWRSAPKFFISKMRLTLLIRGSFTQRCDHGIMVFWGSPLIRVNK